MSSFAFSENTSQMNPKEIRALYDLIDDALKDVTSDLGLTWSTKATNINNSSGETKANSNHVNRENIELLFNPTPTPIVNNYVDNYFTHTECNDAFYFHNGFFEPQQEALSSPPMLCINCSGLISNNQTAHLTPPVPQQPQEVNRKRRRGSVQSSCSSNNSSPTQVEFVDFKSNNKIKKKNNKKNNYNVRFSHNLFDEMKFKKQNPQQTFFKLKL
ncbi:hypothetical protein ABK040_001750 [Willaertia magna]